jgi:hypothetical protein
MIQTGQACLVGKSCVNCGALYEVTIRRQLERDDNHQRCESCGQVRAEWNDIVVPSFELVELPRQASRNKHRPLQHALPHADRSSGKSGSLRAEMEGTIDDSLDMGNVMSRGNFACALFQS